MLRRTNQKTCAVPGTDERGPSDGRTGFPRSRGRRAAACDSNTFIVKKKMATFLPKAKHTKSGPVTAIGQPPSSATNCTKPVGAWRSYSKKFCSRVLFQIRQTREAPKKSNSLSFGVL